MRNTLSYEIDNQVNEYNYLAIRMLERIGIIDPTQEQIDIVEEVVSTTSINLKLIFDRNLTKKETACLYWAAQGKSSRATADLLGVSQATIEWMRKEIKRKLKCDNITHAVFEGIRYGYIHANFQMKYKKADVAS